MNRENKTNDTSGELRARSQEPSPIVLAFTGDVFLGRSPISNAFHDVASHLPCGTQLIVNFEGTLFRNAADLIPARMKILLESSFSLLPMLDPLPIALSSVGNNHIADYGNAVAKTTLDLLAKRFPVLGAGLASTDFHILKHWFGDIRIGFASYCASDTSPQFCSDARIGPRPLVIANVRKDLKRLSQDADHLVALVHWGLEDFHHPRPAHVKMGRALIDAGFKLVIGTHPHTAQGYERYRDGWIFYSLGNFYFPDHEVNFDGRTFDVQWMPRRSWGVMPFFKATKESLVLYDIKFVRQMRNGTPRFSTSLILRRKFQAMSKAISTRRYVSFYRSASRRESLRIRFEEFRNNKNKITSIIRKLLGVLKFTGSQLRTDQGKPRISKS